MPNNNLSYPKVCKRKDGKYYIDFKLNNIRYRLFSGRLINSSLYPNSFPVKLRRTKTFILAKQVYHFIVSNNYSLYRNMSTVEKYDSIINNKLAEPLSNRYRKTLFSLSSILRKQLIKKGKINTSFIDSIALKYASSLFLVALSSRLIVDA